MIPGITSVLEHQYATWKDLIFWVLKQNQLSLELIFIISWLLWNNRNARWAGENVMSHSTLIQCGMDLYQQVQAVKEWRFLEHLCSSVRESSIFQEEGKTFKFFGLLCGVLLLLPLICLFWAGSIFLW
jgi:hypothetical protein